MCNASTNFGMGGLMGAYWCVIYDKIDKVLTLIRGGANMPQRFSNTYSSGTEHQIDLKPGSKFEFIRCLEVYTKRQRLRDRNKETGI